MKTIFNALIVLFVAFSFNGCAKKQPLPTINFPNKSYDSVGYNSNITLALCYPNVKIEMRTSDVVYSKLTPRLSYHANKMSCSLLNEIEENLISKGFKVKYIVKNLQGMTSAEKKDTEVLICPSIRINIDEDSTLYTHTFTHIGIGVREDKTNIIGGTLSMDGYINIAIIEPMSNKELWREKLNIQNVAVAAEYHYSSMVGGVHTTYSSTAQIDYFWSDMYNIAKTSDKVFLDAYLTTLNTVDRDITVERVGKLKSEIAELKKQ